MNSDGDWAVVKSRKRVPASLPATRTFPDDYPVAVQFPARILPRLLNDPYLRNCFETGSSGGTTSFKDRKYWEDGLFSQYGPRTPLYVRPKYGFLYGVNEVTLTFGDCLFLMNSGIRRHCTATLGDSSRATRAYGLESLPFSPTYARGKTSLDCGHFDNYVEVQIHLPRVRLATYVDTLITSTDYLRDEQVKSQAEALSEKLDCKLEWRKRF
jgi:hypothetical protein